MQSVTMILLFLKMDSFKVYLPSNASVNDYPDNTPTDYRTRLSEYLSLNGEWEVGVESIFYSSHIEDNKEKALIQMIVKSFEQVPVNDTYPYKFCTTSTGKWKGYASNAVMPQKFETDPKKIKNIIDTLNAMNKEILESPNKKVFEFYLNEKGQTCYKTFDPAFVFSITGRLSRVLGYGYKNVYYGKKHNIGSFYPREPGKGNLTQEDYTVKYFNSKVQRHKARVMMKPVTGEWDRKPESFAKMWNDTVGKVANAKVEFKNGKLIIHVFDPKISLAFSPNFAWTFKMNKGGALIGNGSFWAGKSFWVRKSYTNQVWFVDIYSTDLELTGKSMTQGVAIELLPWSQSNFQNFATEINQSVERKLKEELKERYDAKHHFFELTIQADKHSYLKLGKWLITHFSRNLSNFLGFPDRNMKASQMSEREVDQLINRQRPLFLLSSVIPPTAYGKHKLPILQNFLHKATETTLIEKVFEPIIFLPVISNIISMIELQLTNEFYQPVPISDSKTIVTLSFRKVRESNVM